MLRIPETGTVDVVGLGVSVLNHLYVLPNFPEPDTKMDPVTVAEQGGGVVATALVACARLGLRAKYLGKVGADDAGRRLSQSLADEGIDVKDLVVDPHEHTRVTVGLIEQATGRRTLIRGMSPRARLRPGEAPAAAVTAGRILHLDGYEGEAAVWAARLARAAGVPVSLDAEDATECREDLFALADVLIVGKEQGREITGRGNVPEILEGLAQFGARIVGLTLGPDGAVVREGETVVTVPGLSVEVVDTTGAGDVFHGAFLAGLLWGWPLPATAHLANAAAALKCRRLGGQAGIPSLEEVRAALRHQDRDLPATPSPTFAGLVPTLPSLAERSTQ